MRNWNGNGQAIRLLRHRQEGSEIAQMAVLTGAVVAVGIGITIVCFAGDCIHTGHFGKQFLVVFAVPGLIEFELFE